MVMTHILALILSERNVARRNLTRDPRRDIDLGRTGKPIYSSVTHVQTSCRSIFPSRTTAGEGFVTDEDIAEDSCRCNHRDYEGERKGDYVHDRVKSEGGHDHLYEVGSENGNKIKLVVVLSNAVRRQEKVPDIQYRRVITGLPDHW